MKRRFWLGLVPMIALLASGALWLTDSGSPPVTAPGKAPAADNGSGEHPARGLVLGAAPKGTRAMQPRRAREDTATARVEPALAPSWLVSTAPGEANAYDLADPADREALVKSLRAQGVPEQDMQYVINSPDNGAGAKPTADPTEAQVYALNDPSDRELLAESLRAAGVPEQDLQYVMNLSAEDFGSAGETPDPTEAHAYDMADPADRQAFAESLAAQGVRAEDMGYVMKGSQDAEP